MPEHKFIGVMKFDTITSLKEFMQICHDIIKRGFKIELCLEKELEEKIIPEGSNIQLIITK